MGFRHIHRLHLPAPSAPEGPTDNDLALVALPALPLAARVATRCIQEGEVEECIRGWVPSLEEERVEIAELLGEGGGVDDAGAEEAVGDGGVLGQRGGEEEVADAGVGAVGAYEESARGCGAVGKGGCDVADCLSCCSWGE